MKIRVFFGLISVAILMLAEAASAAQTDNHVLHAVPPPGTVEIDGKLNDWDLSGQIEVFANYRTRNTYSTKAAAMYDKDYFYLAVLWRDPTPMYNVVDPDFDIGSGWKSDCVELRVRTDIVMHIDCWYSTAKKRPVIKIERGSFNEGPMNLANMVQKYSGMPEGSKEAFTMGDDGKSYTQEIALPWKLITGQGVTVKETGKPFAPPKEYKAGDTFDMGIEFLWGGVDGKTFPIHRYADLLKEGTSSREFFWTAENAWGTVKLEPKGNLKLPPADYGETEAYLQKTEGPIELAYAMPFDGFATLVIEDEQGHRVRNLIGMAQRAKGKQIDHWDCTDEDGKLVSPGKYRFRGLLHQGIDPVYEASYGNPGTPPWDIGDGSGSWLSDLSAPNSVTASKDLMVLGAETAESGYSMLCCDLNGRKKWGDRTFLGIYGLSADEQHVYVFLSAWNVKPTLARVDLQTGKFAPFATKNGEQLRIPVFKEDEKVEWAPGIAVGKEFLAMSISGDANVVRFYDKQSAEVAKEVPVPMPGPLAYDSAGTLYVWSKDKLVKLDGEKLVPVIENAIRWPESVAIDANGQFYLSDRAAQQVKVYGKDGKFVRAIGVEGGRPATGKWQPNGMLNPVSLAIDSQGRLWAAEFDVNPKRFSVWNTTDGKLVKDFIGPTTYGGSGAYADPDDKTRVFGVGCEFKLDYKANKAQAVTALGPALPGFGQLMKIDGREYFMSKMGQLFLNKAGSLKLVATMGSCCAKDFEQVKWLSLAPPGAAHGYATASYIWSDLNDDGKAQAEEVTSGSAWTNWDNLKYPVGGQGYFGSYWLDERFNLYGFSGASTGTSGTGPFITKTALKGWTRGGAPVWDVKNQKLVSDKVGGMGGLCLYLPTEGKVIVGEPITCVRDDGTVLWTFKDNWPGVHGSHNAPIPDRDDQFVGTLGCIGRAKTKLGTVFAMHSNMGRLYLMTTDGLHVASVFVDSRLGGEPYPAEARVGAPMGGVTMGSEWFGGHFFKSEKTDEYYLIAGFNAYNLIKLNGLDSLTAIKGDSITVSAKELRAAEALLQQRAARDAARNTLTIAKAAAAPAVDGKLDEYAKESFVEWAAGPYRARAALSVDAGNLYLAYDVSGDGNPMVNGGKDVNQLFVTGDSVDLQLGTNAAADPGRGGPAVGDLRLLISVCNNEPVAVLYRWTVDGPKQPVRFSCSWRSCDVDSVTVLKDAKIGIARRADGYAVEAAVPLAALGFAPQQGKSYKADLGVIYSDAKGDNRAARVYWANKATGLTSDVPGEIMANPSLWGTAKIAP